MDQKNTYSLIKIVLKRARARNQRTIFGILGPEGSKQIPVFHELLARGKAKQVSVLSCSNGTADFGDVENSVHQSFNLAVLHDFENISLSTLSRIVESVEGGGALLFLSSMVKEMTEFTLIKISPFIESRFMRRLFISFTSCHSCFILNDKAERIFHVKDSSDIKEMDSTVSSAEKLQKLKSDTASDTISHALINLCQTTDQANLLLKFIDALKKKDFHSIMSVSSPRGRGKSATLGLAIAGSLALNYSNVFISSPNYDNVKIIFKFLFKGLDALNYKEGEHYDLIQSVNPKFNNALLGVDLFKDQSQKVRFILPEDADDKFESADLVVVDGAASIPLSLLKRLIGSYIVLMASTINGFGGAGKYLYEHVIKEIRQPVSLKNEGKVISSNISCCIPDKKFQKLTLNEPIFYASGDGVENWINQLLCLEGSINASLSHGCPQPQQCRLFYVCPETLFSYENHAEKFLQQLMSLFWSSKRNISPDYLLKMADDKDYHIFVLVSPFTNSEKITPEIMCAILVHAEKQIPCSIIGSGTYQSKDLSHCFNEWKNIPGDENTQDFLPKNGIHIIDIVTHPEYRRMGYGLRALQLLQEFYDGKWIPLDDNPFIYSRDENSVSHSMPPLLLQLTEVKPEKVEYLSVSYYLTPEMLKFWKKSGFVPLFISQEKNSDEEYMSFMIKSMDKEFDSYMKESWIHFRNYFFRLLKTELNSLSSTFALNILKCNFSNQLPKIELTKEDVDCCLPPKYMKLLEKYCQNLVDLHSLLYCITVLAELYFQNYFTGVVLSVVQEVILLSFGFQRKTTDDISKDLGLPPTQVHGLHNRTIRKLTNYLNSIIEKSIETSFKAHSCTMEPLSQTIDEELEEAAQKIKLQQMEETKKLKDLDFSQYAIKGSEDDWEKALHTGRKTLVSIKSIKKAPEDVEFPHSSKSASFKAKKKFMKRKR